jgi:hypothetical protein
MPLPDAGRSMNVLILYDGHSTFTNTVWDHLAAFKLYLPYRVFYCHGVGHLETVGDLSEFDVVIVHYGVRVAYKLLSPKLDLALQRFPGPKILFVQDEYDYTENTRQAIERLGIDVVFTCVPGHSIEKVYAPARFPRTRFVPNLTGYVAANHPGRDSWRPLRERKFFIGYRGRNLAFWYGNLAREKRYIGERMHKECRKRGIPVDIEWTDSRRIYGEAWLDFLSNCRVTLGTESGSNVFDDTGAIRSAIQALLKRRPGASYEEVFERFLAPHEGRVTMNQISPRIFEAACLGTGLVLFEGDYSGVVLPDVHYIPLKKDFSNVEDVLAKIRDDELLGRMINRTYTDIIASGRYGYAEFMKTVSTVIEEEARRKAGSILGWPRVVDRGLPETEAPRAHAASKAATLAVSLSPVYRPYVPPAPLVMLVIHRVGLSRLWNALPGPVRDGLRPAVRAIISGFRAP